MEHAQQSVEVMTETVDRAIETARAQRGARPAQAGKKASQYVHYWERSTS